MRLLMMSVLLALFAVVTGCNNKVQTLADLPPELSKVVTVVYSNKEAEIPATGSYSWKLKEIEILEDERIKVGDVDRKIREIIGVNLLRKGYRPDSSQMSDIQVAYMLALEGTMNDDALSKRYGFDTNWHPAGKGNKIYEKGTLVIDVFTSDYKRPVWRGALQAGVDLELPEKIRQQRLESAIGLLLEDFPSKKQDVK